MILRKLQNLGLDWEKTKAEMELPEKHLAGAAEDYPVLVQKGWLDQWMALAPEIQKGNNVETMACTVFGTWNIIEMILSFKKMIRNFSDRFTAKMCGVSHSGGSVDAPVDSIRHDGWLLEEEYSWNRDSFSWADFYAVIKQSLINLAKSRVGFYSINHQYILDKSPDNLVKMLKTSPLGVAVAAWEYDNIKKLYVNTQHSWNHWTTIVDYEYGKYWICGDTYPTDFQVDANDTQSDFTKKLAWNYDFGCIKRYSIELGDMSPVTSFCLVDVLRKFFNKIKSMVINFVKDPHMGYWILKGNKKQKITSWWGVLVLLAELLNPKLLRDDELAQYKDVAGTKERFFPETN